MSNIGTQWVRVECTLKGGSDVYTRLSSGTNVEIEMECNRHCDLLEIRGDPVPSEALQPLRDLVGIKRKETRSDGCVILTEDCLLDHTETFKPLEDYLYDSADEQSTREIITRGTTKYIEGKKQIHLIGKYSDIKKFHDEIRDGSEYQLQVDRTKPVREGESLITGTPNIRKPESYPVLTKKQFDVIKQAACMDYYNSSTTQTEITDKMNEDGELNEDMNRQKVSDRMGRGVNNILKSVIKGKLYKIDEDP